MRFIAMIVFHSKMKIYFHLIFSIVNVRFYAHKVKVKCIKPHADTLFSVIECMYARAVQSLANANIVFLFRNRKTEWNNTLGNAIAKRAIFVKSKRYGESPNQTYYMPIFAWCFSRVYLCVYFVFLCVKILLVLRLWWNACFLSPKRIKKRICNSFFCSSVTWFVYKICRKFFNKFLIQSPFLIINIAFFNFKYAFFCCFLFLSPIFLIFFFFIKIFAVHAVCTLFSFLFSSKKFRLNHFFSFPFVPGFYFFCRYYYCCCTMWM